VTADATASAHLEAWLAQGYHGEMAFMARHGRARSRADTLLDGARSVIVARLDYLTAPAIDIETESRRAAISRYAWGRDYHKVMRNRLQRLAEAMTTEFGPYRFRAVSDSAPLMEVEFARQAGLGWRGKHTLLLSRQGSWFFLGELLTDLALDPDLPITEHCGDCRACLDACPTGAIVAPYQVDARRCISYLTIELKDAIPEALRPLLGNRIYGCDDCQLICPWNRFARLGREADFLPRHDLDRSSLIELFAWSETSFADRLAGSPIRRIGHARWLRNIAVALGNCLRQAHEPHERATVQAALLTQADHPAVLVREHVAWALAQGNAPIIPVGDERPACDNDAP